MVLVGMYVSRGDLVLKVEDAYANILIYVVLKVLLFY